MLLANNDMIAAGASSAGSENRIGEWRADVARSDKFRQYNDIIANGT
jgi:hypothetical protein